MRTAQSDSIPTTCIGHFYVEHDNSIRPCIETSSAFSWNRVIECTNSWVLMSFMRPRAVSRPEWCLVAGNFLPLRRFSTRSKESGHQRWVNYFKEFYAPTDLTHGAIPFTTRSVKPVHTCELHLDVIVPVKRRSAQWSWPPPQRAQIDSMVYLWAWAPGSNPRWWLIIKLTHRWTNIRCYIRAIQLLWHLLSDVEAFE